MNQRRDQQHGRSEFGHHNVELADERLETRASGPGRVAPSGPDEGDDGASSLDAMPAREPNERPNEGLSNDYSIEGTRKLAREERRAKR